MRYFSPSSLALGAQCPRAWAYRYLDRLREPEIAWEDIERGVKCTPRQRSASLGRAVHTVFETYFAEDRFEGPDLPRRVALSGLHLVPHPSEIECGWVERPIGTPRPSATWPPAVLNLKDVEMVGYVDLLARTRHGWLLVDFKTTKSIDRFARTAAELAQDLAACIYALDVMFLLDQHSVDCRWVYLETDKVRRASAVDFRVSFKRAWPVVAEALVLARELKAISVTSGARQNPAACADYGGCVYHESTGGPCVVRRSIGALVAARRRGGGGELNTARRDPGRSSRGRR